MLLPINQMTVEVWVKPNDVVLDIDRAIVTKTEGGSFNLALNHWSRTSDGRFSFNLYSSIDYNSVESSEHTGINSWFHIAGTFDGNLMRIYVNGQLEGTQNNPGTITSSSVPMLFGAEPQEGLVISHFKGQIDEIRIWNYARTGEEIMQFMNIALKGNEPGLVRYWNFDEGSGQVVHDIVGYQNGQLGEIESPDTFDPTWSLDSAPVFFNVFLPIIYKSP